LRAGQFEAVADEWEQHCSTIGQEVTVQIGSREIHGRAESLDADGTLRLRTQHGQLERIIGGDVTVKRKAP
jgi:BirA family biotin operon repressor/biotin-[acetyl-CoA-carboxylase] ligase